MGPYLEKNPAKLRLYLSAAPEFPEHLHPQAELLYVFRGQANLCISGQLYALEAGDLCCCFPGVMHGYRAPRNARTLMMIFAPELFPDFAHLLACFSPANPVIRSGAVPSAIAFCMEQLRQELCGETDDRVVRGYLQVALAKLIPLLPLTPQSPQNHDIAYRMLQYISAHFTEPVTLADAAQALNVSVSHLSHTFSRQIGTNFRGYINILRIDHACTLLRSTEKSITEIAFECGFENLRSFHRAFSRRCHCSPGQYRENPLQTA